MRFAGRTLRSLVALCCRHAHATVVMAIALAVLSAWLAWTRLEFEASPLHLLPSGQPYVTRYREYSRDFGELDEMVIAIRAGSFTDAQAFAARLVATLKAGPIAFNHLAYRVTPAGFDGRALLYLPLDDLRQLRDQVLDHQELVETFVVSPGLVTLLEGANEQFAQAFVGRFFDLGLQDGAPAGGLRFATTLLAQLRDASLRPQLPATPWGAMFPLAGDEADAGYFLSDDKQLLFVLADPVGGSGGFTNDRATLQEIRARIAGLRAEFPNVRAGVTGGPALANDEMVTAFEDSRLATGLAFVLTLGLLLLAFRRFRDPLVMLGVLALSLVWSLGLIAVTVGHLTVFSVMFISIVIGLGIDYGIYVLFRRDEEIARGAGPAAALELMAARTGPGILLGALTAAATFYALAATDFHGVQELGFIAGTALISSFVAMLTVFPALLVLLPARSTTAPPASPARSAPPGRDSLRFVDWLTRHPTAVLVGAGILTVGSAWSARGVSFDFNLLHLQARDAESVVWEQYIVQTQNRSSFAGLDSATSLPELERKRALFAQLPSVGSVDSALLFIPDDQSAKVQVIHDLGPVLAPLRLGAVPRLSLARLSEALERFERRVNLAASEAGSQAGPLRELQRGLEGVRTALRTGDPAEIQARLERYQGRLAREFGEHLRQLQKNLQPRAVTLADVPPELRRKFVSDSGRFLLQIHPSVDVWDREGSTRFVNELRSVDADVTGTPVISYESIRRMEDAYRRGAVYAFILVTVISVVMIRRLRETALALTPLVLGPLWALGIMQLFGFRLNLANVWGLPLIIGASAEYGLNVVTRAMEARAQGEPSLPRGTMLAVLFNGLTTITGFGSLMLAHHRGIRSLGLLLTCGSLASLVAALVVLPVLIGLFRGTHRA